MRHLGQAQAHKTCLWGLPVVCWWLAASLDGARRRRTPAVGRVLSTRLREPVHTQLRTVVHVTLSCACVLHAHRNKLLMHALHAPTVAAAVNTTNAS